MSKKDYEVIVFKILVYLYGCLKADFSFSFAGFDKATSRKDYDDKYFATVIRMMQNDGLIEGAVFEKVWGNSYVMINDYSDLAITSAGITFVSENDKMKKVKEILMKIPGYAAEIIGIVLNLNQL